MKSYQEHDALLNNDQDSQIDSLPEDLDRNIMKLTRDLFIASKLEQPRLNDPEYAKMQNMSKTAMLNEVEQMINQHLDYFADFEQKEPEELKKMKRKIRKKEMEDNQKEKKLKEEQDKEDYKKNKAE